MKRLLLIFLIFNFCNGDIIYSKDGNIKVVSSFEKEYSKLIAYKMIEDTFCNVFSMEWRGKVKEMKFLPENQFLYLELTGTSDISKHIIQVMVFPLDTHWPGTLLLKDIILDLNPN